MAEIPFEKALEKLEKIVAQLEEGNITLEDALARYEEGIKLSRVCQEKLSQAEKKIELLSKNAKGELVRKPFEPEEEAGEEPVKPKKGRKAPAGEDEEALF